MAHIAVILSCAFLFYTTKDSIAYGFNLQTGANRNLIKVSSSGKDVRNCWTNIAQPCRTLSFAFSKPDLNNTTVIISNENHYLNDKILVDGFEDLTLKSEHQNGQPNIICTGRKGSFSFTKGTNLTLNSLSIMNCGTNHTSTSKINGTSITLVTSFFLKECVNVNADNVKIYGSRGMGAVLYDVGGIVFFNSVTFMDNHRISLHKRIGLSSGGGIYIEFTLGTGKNLSVYNTNAKYIFQACIFQNNVAESNLSLPSPDDDPQNYISFGRGGAVSLMSLGTAARNMFMFNNCTFRNNTALWGAAIFAEFHGNSGNNEVSIKDSVFVDNHVSYSGGAIRTGLASNNSFGYNLLSLERCKFLRNHAGIGGGFSQYRLYKQSMDKEVVRFRNCTFMQNSAYLGSAMHMSVSQFELHDVHFSDNFIDNYKDQTSGKGALYLFSSKGILKGENKIENSKWTGVVLEFSSLEIFDDVVFSNNTGVNGGAIATYAESFIVLKEGSRVSFIGNTAIRQGGALYVQTPGPPMAPMNSTEFMVYKCVILFGSREDHPDNFNTKVTFINNTAPAASGSAVFISTLTWCRKYGEKKYNSTGLQWKNFVYISKDSQPVIVTNPVVMQLSKKDWYPPPSIQFQPRIVLRDELWNPVYGTVKVRITSETNSVHLKGSDVFAVRNILPKISITGKEGSVFNVVVETVVGVTIRAVVQNARVDRCPLGYFQSDGQTCKCLSTFGTIKGVTHCQGLDVYILRGRWANPKDKTQDFAMHHCPRSYCSKCKGNGTDGIECLYEKKKQCGENRKWDSVLCGSCKAGYSVQLGNEECDKCDDNSLAWLLLWIFLLTVFVFVILVINIRNYFTYLNAYLYSYQVLPLLLVGNHYLDVFISFVMGLTNFSGTGGNFGVCLWDGMTDMDKMLLNYITPFYILLCVAFFVFLSSYWKQCPFSTKSTLRALALLSIFAYADFTRITFELLHFVNVNGRNVLYIEGDVEIFAGRHIPYGVCAIIVLLVVVILFPLSLFFFPVVTKHFVKLKGVIDSFHEPFKDGYQKFVVFYLVCRLALFAIFVFIESGLVRDTVLAIACQVILIVFLLVNPYTDMKMNYFDTLMLSNIALIGIINVSLDAVTEAENRRGLQYTAVVFTYLPFLCIAVQFSYWLYIELRAYLAKRRNTPTGRIRDSNRGNFVPERIVHDYDEGRSFNNMQEQEFDYHSYDGMESSQNC